MLCYPTVNKVVYICIVHSGKLNLRCGQRWLYITVIHCGYNMSSVYLCRIKIYSVHLAIVIKCKFNLVKKSFSCVLLLQWY